MATSRVALVVIVLSVSQGISRDSAAAQGSHANLGIEGPGLLQEDASGVARGRFSVILGQTGLPAQMQRVTGWSFGIEARGIARWSATTSGTFLDGIPGASIDLETVSGDGAEGIICSVTLPDPVPFRSETVLFLDVEMEPDVANALGLLRTALLPGSNGIAWHLLRKEDGSEAAILDVEARITARPDDLCGDALLGFSLSNVDSDTLLAGVLGGARGDGRAVIKAEEGIRTTVRAYAVLVTSVDAGYLGPVCGWSLSVVVEGDAVPRSVSFRESAVARYFGGGFESTRITDPGDNNGKQGYVSAVVLTFAGICMLPNVGSRAVLEMGLEEAGPHGEMDTEAVLRFEDGLRVRADAPPTRNRIAIRGSEVMACNQDSASLTAIFSLSGPQFLRGDGNADSRVNISDAIIVLRGLFEDAEPTCLPAADANADGRVDISDAIHLLAYLFQGGPRPSEPFPDCGPDPAAEGSLPCLELAPGCR